MKSVGRVLLVAQMAIMYPLTIAILTRTAKASLKGWNPESLRNVPSVRERLASPKYRLRAVVILAVAVVVSIQALREQAVTETISSFAFVWILFVVNTPVAKRYARAFASAQLGEGALPLPVVGLVFFLSVTSVIAALLLGDLVQSILH